MLSRFVRASETIEVHAHDSDTQIGWFEEVGIDVEGSGAGDEPPVRMGAITDGKAWVFFRVTEGGRIDCSETIDGYAACGRSSLRWALASSMFSAVVVNLVQQSDTDTETTPTRTEPAAEVLGCTTPDQAVFEPMLRSVSSRRHASSAN